MHFHRIPTNEVEWKTLDGFEDRVLFQTRDWVNFLAESQRAVPVVAALYDSGDVIGYFTGLVFSRMGMRILGSPFPGWITPYMGFNLRPGIPRAEALRALEVFAFRELQCLHLEVSDRFCTVQDGESLGFSCEPCHTLVTDLRQPEQKILRSMSESCRWSIRKAEKAGVRIEEACDEEFAEDYYEQFKDVLAKQGLVPAYGLTRIKQLIRHMLPTGKLLLLRARDPQGVCIATGIYPALNKVADFWGNASFRQAQHLRPNELLHWHAVRYWKQRGVELFDWGGGVNFRGVYKTKYGGEPLCYPRFRKSRFAFLDTLRMEARTLFHLGQRLRGRLQGNREVSAGA
jgi:hypothetical protein